MTEDLKNVALRVPESLLNDLTHAAAQRGISRNDLMIELLASVDKCYTPDPMLDEPTQPIKNQLPTKAPKKLKIPLIALGVPITGQYSKLYALLNEPDLKDDSLKGRIYYYSERAQMVYRTDGFSSKHKQIKYRVLAQEVTRESLDIHEDGSFMVYSKEDDYNHIRGYQT